MCDFKPGDEVVCVDAVASKFTRLGYAPPLVEGQTYEISDIFEVRTALSGKLSGQIGVALAGLEWGVNGVRGAWTPSRFRKVQRRDLSAWLETAATDTDHLDKPIKTPARPKVDALLQRVQSGEFG